MSRFPRSLVIALVAATAIEAVVFAGLALDHVTSAPYVHYVPWSARLAVGVVLIAAWVMLCVVRPLIERMARR